MSSSYDRLLYAARELRKLKSPADVARALTEAGYNTSDQTMTNWQARGVSARGCLAAARLFGCRAQWLEIGEGKMQDWTSQSAAKQGDAAYEFTTEEITEVIGIMRQLDKPLQQQLLGQAKMLLHEQGLVARNYQKRTGA